MRLADRHILFLPIPLIPSPSPAPLHGEFFIIILFKTKSLAFLAPGEGHLIRDGGHGEGGRLVGRLREVGMVLDM